MFPDPRSSWGYGACGGSGGHRGCRGTWLLAGVPHVPAWVPAVSGGSVEAEQELQARFRAVLRWPQGRAPLHLTTSLQLGLVLGVAGLVLLLLLLL